VFRLPDRPHRPEAQDVALSRPKHGFESRWGRHFISRALSGSQVIERVGGYGGSNKLFSVERDTLTKEQLCSRCF
jgi:hypothetical protein